MSNISEPETLSDQQIGQVLESLPVLRRWLLVSLNRGRVAEGARPLPLSHVRVLVHLCWHGPMTVGKLARDLGVSCSTATECIAELENRGRVVKQRSESDRRRVVVSLTPEARAFATGVLSQRRAVVEAAFQKLSPAERRAFVRGMRLLAGAAGSWMDAALPEEGGA